MAGALIGLLSGAVAIGAAQLVAGFVGGTSSPVIAVGGVAIDATPTEENRSAQTRAEQIGRLTGATVYVLHVARAHIIPGDIIGGAGFGVRSADEDVEGADRQAVQALVDRLSAAGVDAHGEIVSATQHDVAGAILQRATELNVDDIGVTRFIKKPRNMRD